MFSLLDLHFVLCSRDLHVLRAQRIIDVFILITHKAARSENPIARLRLVPFFKLQAFSLDLYLGHFWRDPRLAFGLNRTIILGGEAIEKLWVPDTFFINSVDTKIHKMMFSNKKIWINLINGTMMLSAR